ncbi:glycoside hydrolase [Actinoplanes sp. RD1]|uniref:glycoside hydrolase n=1 Tax=Actinoplanes sp. RD1 TaxID=3064538 RepID=UPI002742360C|nr:glycoside hydrolase [Actinoplanes sp. RD1]
MLRQVTAALAAAIVGFGVSPAHAQPQAPGDATNDVTVRPDPAYQGQAFEGWGTSLVWFANATGDYPDEIREKLADLVFGEDGLNLNIARYNIGGGNAPDVPDYLRKGGAVEGWWQAPEGTTRADKDWWDPADPAHWNLDADATQRWWVDRIKQDVTHWETFSNSPPYFQTTSGYVSGNFDAGQDQIRADTVDDFATYLVRVTQELERAHGIKVGTIDPLNEPNTTYWGTQLGPDGNPTGGRQEGAHAGPALQQRIITALAAELDAAGSDTVISAMDETNPGTFATNWNAYSPEVRALVRQLNVHTYGTGQRTTVRDIAKGERKPLWMSEVEGSWGAGQSFTSMEPGLGMARHIVDDLRELEPSAWVFWQPVEDYDNMKPGGESAAGANWGSIQLPFDCTAADTLETCPIYTNTKFDTVRNFTHYVRPGDKLIEVDDTSSVAAVTGNGRGATVVHVNDGDEARTVQLDLSAFGSVARGATVTPVVTDASGALRRGKPVRVRDRAATVQVPARSVTTLLVTGVSGVAAAPSGHVFRLEGVQSGKSLDGTVIRTTDPASATQLWTLTKVAGGASNRAEYTVSSAGGYLTGTGTGVTLSSTPSRWILSTTGDGTYTLIDVTTKRLLEVGGQATADGSPVSTYLANSGANQRWTLIDETVLGVRPAAVFTPPGIVPQLPATVDAVRPDGVRGTLPVTWQRLPDSTWRRPRTVTVTGRATDPLGHVFQARAVVEIDTLVRTEPAQARTFTGAPPDLPATVTAVGRRGIRTERAVVWAPPAPGAFDEPGVVTVAGRADAGDGRTLPATARVTVTEPVEEQAATAGVTATFTEPGYSPAGLTNGDRTDKAWSNWKSGAKNPSDTLTVALPRQRVLSKVAVHFYRDGGDSYPRSVQLQVRDAAGGWADAGAPVDVPSGGSAAPVVTVPASATSDAVRVVLTARPEQHITMSEIEVYALTAAS